MEKKILLIKNGNCRTEIDLIIRELDNEYIIESINSSSINNNLLLKVLEEYSKPNTCVIILGGPQSLVDRDTKDYEYKYLNTLINFTRIWIDNNIRILGICLGAQIIAEALGHKTKQIGYKEAGYRKKYTVLKKNDPFLGNIDELNLRFVLCHHNDYVYINSDNINIIIEGERDGFNIPYVMNSNRAYGLQFHPEVTLNILTHLSTTYAIDMNIYKFAYNNQDKIKSVSYKFISLWLKYIQD